jgi:G:T-mismatch repair DNA endonuclease (very short patch repair protein)
VLVIWECEVKNSKKLERLRLSITAVRAVVRG